MGDTSNARSRREREGFFEKYIQGTGLDIGAGSDPLTPDCAQWDMIDGDAQFMQGAPNEFFDWVYSSHCLEHMVDPGSALHRWWELVKPGGYMIIVVPDEDLYERGLWPSHLNPDHKSTWCVDKVQSWSPVCHSLKRGLESLPGGQIEHVKLQDAGYDRSLLNSLMAQVIVSESDLAVRMETEKKVNAEILGGRDLRCLGFWPIDQTGCPFYAEASVEGIIKKL